MRSAGALIVTGGDLYDARKCCPVGSVLIDVGATGSRRQFKTICFATSPRP